MALYKPACSCLFSSTSSKQLPPTSFLTMPQAHSKETFPAPGPLPMLSPLPGMCGLSSPSPPSPPFLPDPLCHFCRHLLIKPLLSPGQALTLRDALQQPGRHQSPSALPQRRPAPGRGQDCRFGDENSVCNSNIPSAVDNPLSFHPTVSHSVNILLWCGEFVTNDETIDMLLVIKIPSIH